jgi:endonuclease III
MNGRDISRLKRVVAKLESLYGLSRHGNVRDVFWELIFIVLSIRTDEKQYRPIFRKLKRRYPSLRVLALARVSSIAAILRPLGLARLRSVQLKHLAVTIQRDYGARGLNALGQLDHVALERYLQQFHGVGAKIAKCVSLYAIDAPSLPVDTHVWRLMTRLGFAPGGRLTEAKALSLESVVPPELRFKVHVLALSHGRAVCKSVPECERCIIRRSCPSYPVLFRESRELAAR